MKKMMIVMLLLLTSCGYTSRNSEFTGQIKFVENVTPLLCGDRVDAGVSLGTMRNGIGSMSTHDITVTAAPQVVEALRSASTSGIIVKLTYDERRFVLCSKAMLVTKVEPAL